MPSVEINTAHGVTIEYEAAALRYRILAYIIDHGILIMALVVLVLVSSAFDPYGELLQRLMLLVYVPIYAFYTPVFEIILNGQTPGKRALGIRVIRLDGHAPGPIDYLIRWAFRLVDIFLSIGIVACMLISSTPHSQRLGGLLSGTAVMRLSGSREFRLEDIMSIGNTGDYEPAYPGVRKYAEKDMLLIKEALDRMYDYANDAHRHVVATLADKVKSELQIATDDADDKFLKTVLKDYVVLSR